MLHIKIKQIGPLHMKLSLITKIILYVIPHRYPDIHTFTKTASFHEHRLIGTVFEMRQLAVSVTFSREILERIGETMWRRKVKKVTLIPFCAWQLWHNLIFKHCGTLGVTARLWSWWIIISFSGTQMPPILGIPTARSRLEQVGNIISRICVVYSCS